MMGDSNGVFGTHLTNNINNNLLQAQQFLQVATCSSSS